MKQETPNVFSRLLVWQKFLILAAIGAIMVALPLFLYIAEAQKAIDVATLEKTGIPPVTALLKIVQLTQSHKDLTAFALSQGNTTTTDRDAKRKELKNTIDNMNALVTELEHDKGIDIKKNWTTALNRWQKLQEQLSKVQIDSQQSIQSHNELIADYLNLLDEISDKFSLALDSEADSYFLIRSALYSLPKLTEQLSKIRVLGSEVLNLKQTTPANNNKLSGLLTAADNEQNETRINLQKTFALNSEIKKQLETQTGTIIYTQYQDAVNIAQKEILNTPTLSYSYIKYYETYTALIDNLFKFNKESLVTLDHTLQNRIDNLRLKQFAITFSILGLTLLAATSAYYISRGVTKPVGHLVGVMQALAAGNHNVRANMRSLDEIGILGRQFDMMIDQREAINTKILEENDTLNNSIINLLQSVARLAQRDLTVRAIVEEDITGPISDALNMLSDETSKVLNRVTKIAADVSRVSKQVQSQSALIINDAAEEKREVEQTAIELNDASKAMLEIVKVAYSCNQAAEKAIANTDKAQESVLSTVQGITTIRDTIRETEKRIKRLGERSQEIGGIVNLINDIAERTHILALNASMHAASAGEAGRGFAVIANEVQKLAESSRDATSKISALVNNIQVETADTVTTMNNAISQVVRGTDLAQKAGDEMRETRNTTAHLVKLVGHIANSSNKQSETSLKLLERAQVIQKNTEQTYNHLQAQGIETDQLVDLSNNLVSSVSVFTLPQNID